MSDIDSIIEDFNNDDRWFRAAKREEEGAPLKEIVAIIGEDFRDGFLVGSDLSFKNFQPCEDLREVNFSSVDLSGAHFNCSDLSGANLSGADVSEANLCYVNLSEANLSGANLSGANLLNAVFSTANLYNATLPENVSEDHLRNAGAVFEPPPSMAAILGEITLSAEGEIALMSWLDNPMPLNEVAELDPSYFVDQFGLSPSDAEQVWNNLQNRDLEL